MNFKKFIITSLICAGVLGSSTMTAQAAVHAIGCQAQTQRMDCGSEVSRPSIGMHTLYNTPNGPVKCMMSGVVRNHTFYCENCKVILNTEVRLCIVEHEYCPDETGKCNQ